MPINQERIRYRYGMCLNDKCEKCKSKEVQEISARKDFVCSECGKPLRECPPPRKKDKKKLIILGALAALLVIGCGLLLFYPSSEGPASSPKERTSDAKQTATDSVKTDSTAKASDTDSLEISVNKTQQERDSLQAVADSLSKIARQQAQQSAQPVSAPVVTTPTVKAEPTPVPAPKASPAPSGIRDLGYATFKGTWPNAVNGRMVFKTSHAIDSKDPKGRVAEPGDYVIGEWSEGHLVQGIWYGADNQVKGSILIGK